tara:strand:+ start:1021 stop:1278 length:258 start_codon:yes stop_codon:yes gene_type:complete
MVNVVVAAKKAIRVTANTTGETIQSSTPVTLKNTLNLNASKSTSRLDNLVDVSEPNTPTDGATLVYNSSTDIYEVKELDLDGGSF